MQQDGQPITKADPALSVSEYPIFQQKKKNIEPKLLYGTFLQGHHLATWCQCDTLRLLQSSNSHSSISGIDLLFLPSVS